MIIPLNGLGIQKRMGDGTRAIAGAGMPVIALQIIEDGGSVSAARVLAINKNAELEWLEVDESLMWGPLVVQVAQPTSLPHLLK